jgi:hypothetical protein
VGAPVGNPIIVGGIDLIHRIITLKVPNFPEILDEIPEFSRKFGDLGIS